MTSVTIEMPEDLAEQVKAAGLLQKDSVAAIFGNALRQARATGFFEAVRRNQADGPALIDPLEIEAEIEQVRKMRRS